MAQEIAFHHSRNFLQNLSLVESYHLKQFQSCCVPQAGGAGIYACGMLFEEIGFSH
jgi:hypothetical protein